MWYEAFEDLDMPIRRLRWCAKGWADANDWRLVQDNAVGVRYAPLSTRGYRCMGTRDRLLQTAAKYPDRLRIELDALASWVIFDAHNRAVGVECLKGERLYRAHAAPSAASGERCAPHARS